jgi:flagellar motility protein MotE (MotC chaperone)
MMINRRHPSGISAVRVIMLLAGVAFGMALGIVPRFFGADPMNWIKRDDTQLAVKTTVIEKDKSVKTYMQLRDYINDVKKQRAMLEEREKPLVAQEARLKQEQESLAKMKTELDAIEKRILESNVTIQAAETKNIKKLAKMWAQMEVEDAARVVKGLDLDLAAKVLSIMQEKQAAPILASLSTPTTPPNTFAVDLINKLKHLKPENKTLTEAQ